MTRIIAFLTAILLSTAATAQRYPEQLTPGLNDFADMIDEGTEVSIGDKITEIFQDHDVHIAIATLSSVQFYAQDTSIEEYATGLFNEWAIGDLDDNNGILILVFRDDRELRVEIGAGYDDDAKAQVERVVQEDIVPLFRTEDYAAGIEAGVDGLLARLIAPPPANTTPTAPASEGSGNTLYYILGGIAAAIAALFGLSKRNAAKFAAQPCTSCGKTGLQKSREVLKEATLEDTGAGETRISCPSCGHVEATPYTISKLKPEGPQGGGKSKGDGATGKW